MKSLLFLCTENYHQGRFAELLFNHLARRRSLAALATSRGLEVRPHKNIGAMSMSAVQRLLTHDAHLPPPRMPRALLESDLRRAERIIALSEEQHRPLLERLHPRWVARTEFWDLPADDAVHSFDAAFDRIEAHVERLTTELATELVEA